LVDVCFGILLKSGILRTVLLQTVVTMILVLIPTTPSSGIPLPNIGWAEFEIDEISYYDQKPQIALSPDGNVHMVYWQDRSPWILTYACRTNEGDLTVEEIGTAESSLTILDTAIIADSEGDVHIVYSVGKYLQYVTNRAGAWTTTNLTDTLDVWGVGDIAVDSADSPHIIACSGGWLGNIAHITDSSGDWTVEEISDLKPYTIGSYAVTVDQMDRVHVCVCGNDYIDLFPIWYATTTEDGYWNLSKVDTLTTSWNGYWPRPSIVIGYSGEVYLAATGNYVSAAYIPSSDVILYYKNSTDAWGPWHEELVTGSGYLPGRALKCTSWGTLQIMVNEYCDVQHLLSYNRMEESWAWGPSPPEAVSCAAVDSSEAWHVLYVTDHHAREITYSCNGYDLADPPTDVHAEVDCTSVTISWSPPPDSGGLDIECYWISGFGELYVVEPNVTSYTITGLQEEKLYFYDVVAVNQLGEGYSAGSYSFTTGKAPADSNTNPLVYGVVAALLVVAAVVVALLLGRQKRMGKSGD
jgi:hypothetical protein